MLELRASKIGGCVRQYVMLLRSGEEPELTVRQKLYFAVGKRLEPVIAEHAGYPLNILFNDSCKVEIPINNDILLTGHPDGEFQNWVIECKTMRSFAYRKARDRGLDVQFPQYLVQVSVYVKGLNAQGVIFLCLDKDASEITELRFRSEELEPYWQKAVANAEKIARWVGKTRLPGREKGLPKWACSLAYCPLTSCRYHFAHPANIKSKRFRQSGKP